MRFDRTVYFEGTWTDAERQMIKGAARLTEQDQPLDPDVGLLGCPWACTAITLGRQTYYMAHWTHRPAQIFRTTSAAALAGQIQAARPGPASITSAATSVVSG